jgi:hypothetical protein
MTEDAVSALDFEEVLKEQGTFKLALLGPAALDEQIDATARGACRGAATAS